MCSANWYRITWAMRRCRASSPATIRSSWDWSSDCYNRELRDDSQLTERRERTLALLLVAGTLVLSAIGLAPELSSGAVYGNDNALHGNLVKGMVAAAEHGGN